MKYVLNVFILFSLCLLLGACQSGDTPKSSILHAHGGVTASAISDDGNHAIVASINHEIGLWSLADNALLYKWQHKLNQHPLVTAADFSPEGNYALTAEKNAIVLWDVRTGENLNYIPLPHEVLDISLGANGRRALVGMKQGTTEYIDIANSKSNLSLKLNRANISHVDLSYDERYALTSGQDNLAILWDLRSGKIVHKWQHDNDVNFVKLSPNNSYALTTTQQDGIKLWDINSGKLVQSIKPHSITISSAKFSTDESLLILGIYPQQIQVWEIKNSRLRHKWQLQQTARKPQRRIIQAVNYLPSGYIVQN